MSSGERHLQVLHEAQIALSTAARHCIILTCERSYLAVLLTLPSSSISALGSLRARRADTAASRHISKMPPSASRTYMSRNSFQAWPSFSCSCFTSSAPLNKTSFTWNYQASIRAYSCISKLSTAQENSFQAWPSFSCCSHREHRLDEHPSPRSDTAHSAQSATASMRRWRHTDVQRLLQVPLKRMPSTWQQCITLRLSILWASSISRCRM